MRMPSHTTLCSFVFSLLLTSALIPSSGNVSLAAAGAPAAQMAAQTVLNGLRAQGLAGGAELTFPTPAATPASASAGATSAPAASLTPAVMEKILKLMAEKGVDRDMIPLMANALGLSSSGQTWASRSLGIKENNGTVHGFYISRGADQDIVITLGVPGQAVYAYRARRDGTATSGVVFDLQTKQPTVQSAADVQKPLEVQVAYWTSVVASPQTASNN